MATKVPLTARQALICAAVTGWRGDGPCVWSSPAERSTVLAWAASYRPAATEVELEEAFAALLSEALFHEVLYPIFAEPVVFCAFRSEFLRELPQPVSDYIVSGPGGEPVTLAGLTDLWDDLVDEYCDTCGPHWVYWGICEGQGSEGPSGAGYGACLGPSCSWFKDGKRACNWDLQFREERPTGLPDMRSLHRSRVHNANDPSGGLAFCERALRQMGHDDVADQLRGTY